MMRYMKKVLAVCIVSLLVYAATSVIFQGVTGEEMSPTQTPWFYRVFGIELAAMAAIKIFGDILDNRKEQRAEHERQKTERLRIKQTPPKKERTEENES